MKEIGGFLELELNYGHEYHSNALRLNLGRTALEYILRSKKIKKIYIPYYTCEVLLEPINKVGVGFEFYSIDRNLEPVFNFNELQNDSFFLYTNYFGIKESYVNQLIKNVKNLIIDNSQAFYSKPYDSIDTFYSPRKFFGLPDGGYLYTNTKLDLDLDIDKSINRIDHLVGRIEDCAENYYDVFRKNDHSLSKENLKRMSNLTMRLLMNIDYEKIALTRRKNFFYLHEKLASRNLLRIDTNSIDVPMVYPYFSTNSDLRMNLIKKKIYIPCYWPNVFSWVGKASIEYEYASKLLPLPVDQRYSLDDMELIIQNL